MRIVLISVLVIVGIIVVTLVAVFVIASRLPEQHKASRSIRLKQKPQDVYAVIVDFASANTWRPDLERVEILEKVDGHTRFREHGRHGAVTFEVVEDVPASKVVTRIVDKDLGYSGSWTYQFEPTSDGTKLRITEDGVVSNLFFRFMSHYVFGQTSTMDSVLTALAKKFGEAALPESEV
jgi:Polyketide cyclase / dehydrase and lipid transport